MDHWTVVLLTFLLMTSARAKTFTVSGVAYGITVSARTTLAEIWPSLITTPWFGNPALARALALEVKGSLGLTDYGTSTASGYIAGPAFVWSSELDAVAWLSGLNRLSIGLAGHDNAYVFALGAGEEWRSFDPVTNSVVWVPQVCSLSLAVTSHRMLDAVIVVTAQFVKLRLGSLERLILERMPPLQVGLDCRATCANAYMMAVSSSKPTNAAPNPPLLCATIGTLLNGNLDLPYTLMVRWGVQHFCHRAKLVKMVCGGTACCL